MFPCPERPIRSTISKPESFRRFCTRFTNSRAKPSSISSSVKAVSSATVNEPSVSTNQPLDIVVQYFHIIGINCVICSIDIQRECSFQLEFADFF